MSSFTQKTFNSAWNIVNVSAVFTITFCFLPPDIPAVQVSTHMPPLREGFRPLVLKLKKAQPHVTL